jgi:hypothetical protein
VTQNNLFAAAMARAPVSNMTSAYGGIRWGSGLSRMFQCKHTQSRLGGTLWDKPWRYIEDPPLFYADKVDTPLMPGNTLYRNPDAVADKNNQVHVAFDTGDEAGDFEIWLTSVTTDGKVFEKCVPITITR